MKTKFLLLPNFLALLAIAMSLSACNPKNYVVRIEDSVTNKGIYNAHVIIEVEGLGTTVSGFTDSDGYARLSVPVEYKNKPTRLIVEADKYLTQTREVNLNLDSLSERVMLIPVGAEPTITAYHQTPSATNQTETATPTATAPPPLLTATVTSSPTPESHVVQRKLEVRMYFVKNKDTAGGISKELFGSTQWANAIRKVNHIEILQAGQVLLIPTYTVVQGDTIYSISNAFNVSKDNLIDLNELPNPGMLPVGIMLIIPIDCHQIDCSVYSTEP